MSLSVSGYADIINLNVNIMFTDFQNKNKAYYW